MCSTNFEMGREENENKIRNEYRQAGKSSTTSHPGQLSLANHPWVDAMSSNESWGVNRQTARCTNRVGLSVVWQRKLVSDWGLWKRRSAPPDEPCGSDMSYLLTYLLTYLLIDGGKVHRGEEWGMHPTFLPTRARDGRNPDQNTQVSLAMLTVQWTQSSLVSWGSCNPFPFDCSNSSGYQLCLSAARAGFSQVCLR